MPTTSTLGSFRAAAAPRAASSARARAAAAAGASSRPRAILATPRPAGGGNNVVVVPRARLGRRASSRRPSSATPPLAAYDRDRGGASRTEPSNLQGAAPPPSYPPAIRPPPGWTPSMPPPSSSRGWLVALSSPIAIAGIALALSIANPGYVDTTRELLLQNIYRKETTMPRRGGGTQNVDVVVRDGVVYKYNKYSGSVTATAKDGLMVDKNGDIFVVVRGKDDPRRVKKAYLVGNMDEVPPLPANPTEKDKKAQREAMEKTFAQRLNRLPSLKKIYDAPDPVVRPGYQ